MIEIKMEVNGMMCGMCESHVNDAVRKTGLVKKVKSSHAKNCVVITADDDADVDVIKAAIEKEGYTVGGVEKSVKKGLFSR